MANNWSSSYSTLKKNLDKKCEYIYYLHIYKCDYVHIRTNVDVCDII